MNKNRCNDEWYTFQQVRIWSTYIVHEKKCDISIYIDIKARKFLCAQAMNDILVNKLKLSNN